jgi:hypothetical protein
MEPSGTWQRDLNRGKPSPARGTTHDRTILTDPRADEAFDPPTAPGFSPNDLHRPMRRPGSVRWPRILDQLTRVCYPLVSTGTPDRGGSAQGPPPTGIVRDRVGQEREYHSPSGRAVPL